MTGTTSVPLKRADEQKPLFSRSIPIFPARGRVLADRRLSTRLSRCSHRVARRLRYALASLAVVEDGTRVYVDYLADFTGPGADLWRVDDGGEIPPDGFEIVFLLKRGSVYLMAVSWSAAEGNSLSLLRADNSSDFKEIVAGSWYRSPL